jgi:Fur family ferric uptake transcriptional regulator
VSAPSDNAERLAGIGYRMTATRRAVLEAMALSGQPFTVEELCEAVPEVGRATVFRTVKLLQESDVVCRVVLEDGGIRYQLSRSGHHHHLVCGICGTVEEFSEPELDAAIERTASQAGFRLDGHSVELYGRCANCTRR